VISPHRCRLREVAPAREAAVEGTLPSSAGISRLIDAPVSWSAQMCLFDSGPIIGTAE